MRQVLGVVLLLVTCLTLGCSDGRRKVDGKIVKGGQPFTISDKGMFVLAFYAADDTTKSFNATTKQDGTFTILGPESRGIPPGKYKVRLTVQDPYTGPSSPDLLKGKYANPANTPLEVEVGANEVVIDVGK